ncbi:DUF6232 family protein [Nostoc sp.]|uniref:DUF6232 family protein n=1 Tax=Nostoc sp. TaxID=1180 RepID=UPI002FF83540
MAANSFGSNQNITLEKNKVLLITKRTVRFARNVYQTHNISGFSEGEVDIGTIPWVIIIIVLLLGLTISFFNSGSGWLLILLAVAAGIWNFVKPKHYGLLLTLNSGDKKLFTTTDKPGLKKVISVIYDFIESEKEATYQVSVNNNNVTGNFVQGNVGGDMIFNSDD